MENLMKLTNVSELYEKMTDKWDYLKGFYHPASRRKLTIFFYEVNLFV